MKIRSDGRAFDKIRKVGFSRQYITYPEGSCLVELGNTKVILSIFPKRESAERGIFYSSSHLNYGIKLRIAYTQF